ncbi:MAG TPA: TonB-dependent receptor [Deltaproteobacteria bacterium]|nr:TonB-dependent receptor [Deltaproteobacteria bacterium]
MFPIRKGRARLLGQAALALFWSLGLATPALHAARGEAESPEGSGTFPDPGSIEEIVVHGEARPTMDVLAGASISRVGTDERLIEGARIDDLLAEMPGVQIRRFGGVGERFEISIRGSRPEQVPVFLDGVRLDTSLTGRSDLSTLCLDVLQEIQVTRGAGAARAGSGAIGGVVNLVTRNAKARPETRLRVSAGSFGSIEGSLRHARRIDEWSVSGSYCGFHTDGDYRFQRARQFIGGLPTGSARVEKRVNNESDRHTGLFRIGHPIGGGRVRLTQLVSHLDRGLPGLETNPRTRAKERNLSSLTSLGLELPVSLLPSGEFEAVLSHRFERNRFEDPLPFLAGDPIQTRTEVHGSALRARIGLGFDALSGRHELDLLTEARLDLRQSNETTSRSRAGIALRLELESSWWGDRLRLSPSLRMERFEGLDVEWIPGIVIRIEPLDWIVLRSAIARSYRVPSFQELYLPDKGFERGNEDLLPEEAWSFEIGATLESPFAHPWLDGEVEATWFAGEIENGIAFQLISSNVSAPVNTGRSQTRGYEISLRWTPHPWIRTTATRTVTRAKLESTHEQVVGVAVSQTDFRIELGPRDRLKIVGELHYTGRLPVSQNGAAVLPSRIAYDASASIDLTRFPFLHLERFGRALWLSVRGRNLGNAAIRDSRSFPRPGRNFSVALESVF